MSSFSDKMCGKLLCEGGAGFPLLGSLAEASQGFIYDENGSKRVCKAASLDQGEDIPDPGYVSDGSPCFQNMVSPTTLNWFAPHPLTVPLNLITHRSAPASERIKTCFFVSPPPVNYVLWTIAVSSLGGGLLPPHPFSSDIACPPFVLSPPSKFALWSDCRWTKLGHVSHHFDDRSWNDSTKWQ